MKKILFLMLVFALLIMPAAFAANDTDNSDKSAKHNNTEDVEDLNETGDDLDENETSDNDKTAETKTDRQLALAAKFGESENTNPVRIAVHTLLAMENRTGGIGKNISAIAKEFDNSKDATNDAEKKIASRSGIRKFFFGGDVADADKIESEVAKNDARIAKLTTLLEQCTDCTDADKTTIQEKITAIEQENTRLQTLAIAEKKHKGLFGFLKRNK